MQRSAIMACLFLWALVALPAMSAAQGAGGAAAPEIQNVPRPQPSPYFIPSRPPPPRSADDAKTDTEQEQGKDAPQGGGGCRYQERKLELIV